eukprot:TRINITY_DN9298_c0_g1_i1.p1 TRINITY_DN9298_c0_g1~~TRINITY_DN9298_c0_g1_i1.p1  ORF type:complete len:583 (+),score=66.39 TRINITY_DN9298_c0_g1_i1:182-1750(+)
MLRSFSYQQFQLCETLLTRYGASLLKLYAYSAAPAAAQTKQQPQSGTMMTEVPFELPAARIPLRTGRPRLVVLGTGWAGASILTYINPKLYDLTVISPRNHMVFTPLLASTTVGTLEFRSVVLPVMHMQKALHQPQNKFYVAQAMQILPDVKKIICKAEDGALFVVDYDKLAICTGSQGSTFNIPGVHEYAYFLRDVTNASMIRDRLIANVGSSNIPGRPLQERQRLLHTVVVGGGPTGVEFAGELSDLIRQDLRKVIPGRAQDLKVTLIEAAELLGSFDGSLREYAARRLTKLGVRLVQGVVKEVREKEVELKDGRIFPFGLCVWSTGVGPTPFTDSLPFLKTSRGRLRVEEHLNVHLPRGWNQKPPGEKPEQPELRQVSINPEDDPPLPPEIEAEVVPDVYALGDCSANENKPLLALAQVAEQQGRYLARTLNKEARSIEPHAIEPFEYRHLGSMATVGDYGAVFQLGGESKRYFSMAGFVSWVAWRSAYLTRLGSLHKKVRVAMDWTAAMLFGRDLSRW